MAVAATQVGAQPPAVICRICGRPSLRGAKLCDECVAAVKRARHMSTLTSEFLPHRPGRSAHPPLRAPRSSSRPRATRLSWLPTKPGAWGVFIAFTLFGAAVVGTAYLAVQEISEQGSKGQIAPSAIDPSVARMSILPQAPDATARTAGSAATESPAIERSATSPGPAEVPAEVSPAVVDSPQATPLPDKHMPRKAATENRKKPSTRAAPAASGETGGESIAATAATEPAKVVAPPAPAPEPPIRDRWERMNAALATCTSETLLAGVMCTERVRYQYCEGFWGQVPQCRAATRPGLSR